MGSCFKKKPRQLLNIEVSNNKEESSNVSDKLDNSNLNSSSASEVESTQFLPQKYLYNLPKSIPIEKLEYIINQTKRCICKIILNNGGKSGHSTGFFCAFPFPDNVNRLPVLITNNHVLDQNDISINKKISFSLNNDIKHYSIIIDKSRKTYTNETFDITIIEIKETDNLDISLLEIDEDIFNSPLEFFIRKDIYLIQYPESKISEASPGIIKFIKENYHLGHICQTEKGSSGSPILNITNYKVLGIHKGGSKKANLNLGTFIKGAIDEFNKKYKEKESVNSNFVVSLLLKEENQEEKNFQEIKKIKKELDGIKKKQEIGKIKYNENIEINDKTVTFMSVDQKIVYSLPCNDNTLLIDLEKKLYEEYPEYKEIQSYFIYGGVVINNFKTVKENGCGNGIILMMKLD